MIALKLAALVVGAGVLVSLLSPDFDADLLLAIVASCQTPSGTAPFAS